MTEEAQTIARMDLNKALREYHLSPSKLEAVIRGYAD